MKNNLHLCDNKLKTKFSEMLYHIDLFHNNVTDWWYDYTLNTI